MSVRRPVPDLKTFVRHLNKARAEGVQLSPAPRSNVVMRASRPGSSAMYYVGPGGCNCPAGEHGGMCKHLALYMFEHLSDYAEDILREYVNVEGTSMSA